MKPSIPDTGTVQRLDGGNAILRMHHEVSCSKCGAAAIGLCKGGLMRELTVRNSRNARVGDRVKIGLVKRVQYWGYFFAYVIPPAALLAGMAGGHFLATYSGMPALDVITGFVTMIVVSFFSFKRLQRLDASHSIEILQVLSDPRDPGPSMYGQEQIPEYYRSCS